MLVFSPDFTLRSRLYPDYVVSLDELCVRDYGASFFPSSILCIDLDRYESSQTGNNDATMDSAVGISDYVNNRESSSRHLLVELRFDYKSTNNFDYDNMKQKVMHSRSVLLPEPVNSTVFFLYSSQVAPKAKNDFSRRAKQDKLIATWEATSVDGFLNYIKDKSILPYQPLNNLDNIRNSLEREFNNGGLDEVDGLLVYWMEQMDKYEQRYMRSENEAIVSVLLSFLNSLTFPEGSLEKDFVQLRKDDVTRYRR